MVAGRARKKLIEQTIKLKGIFSLGLFRNKLVL